MPLLLSFLSLFFFFFLFSLFFPYFSSPSSLSAFSLLTPSSIFLPLLSCLYASFSSSSFPILTLPMQIDVSRHDQKISVPYRKTGREKSARSTSFCGENKAKKNYKNFNQSQKFEVSFLAIFLTLFFSRLVWTHQSSAFIPFYLQFGSNF